MASPAPGVPPSQAQAPAHSPALSLAMADQDPQATMDREDKARRAPSQDHFDSDDSLFEAYVTGLLDDEPQPSTSTQHLSPCTHQPPGKRPRSLHQTDLFISHPFDGNRFQNWSLEPRRTWLLIGDSTMAWLPRINNVRVQVDCYPGAMLAHAVNILRHRTEPAAWVTTAILSFGLGDKGSSNVAVLRALITSLNKAAKLAFPNAGVYIPMINVSTALPPRIQENVARLNDLFLERALVIPPLPLNKFSTQDDDVQWTVATGKEMWKHWRSYLS